MPVSESRYQALFQSKFIGFVVSDFTGRILDANDEYLRIVGCDRVELEKGLVEWRQLTPPEWLPADDAAIDQLGAWGTWRLIQRNISVVTGRAFPS